MNIGLQPQYPTMWWIDAILASVLIAGIAIQVIINRTTKARARQRYDELHKEWEETNRPALEQRAAGKTVTSWVPPEPEFVLHRLVQEPPAVALWMGLTAGGILLVTAFATIVMMVPFTPRYYDFYVQSGTVEQVESTIAVGDDSVSNQFTVKLAGDPKPYGMTDPRIKTLEGQRVALLCGVGWNNQAADTWTCNLRDYAGSTR